MTFELSLEDNGLSKHWMRVMRLGTSNKSLQLSPKRPSGKVAAAWQFYAALG
jgi:hypothetical protein